MAPSNHFRLHLEQACSILLTEVLLQVRRLVEGADAIGAVLVYRHQGFLPNKRQLRMGGLAALEMAQTLRHLVSMIVCRLSGLAV